MNKRATDNFKVQIATILIACFGMGMGLAFVHLPGISEPPPQLAMGSTTGNWFGHSTRFAYAFGVLLLVFIYIGKRGLLRFTLNAPSAIFWYCLMVACSLPYIWFFVVPVWQDPFTYRITCWIYIPIGIWMVPTASFAWDLLVPTMSSPKAYFIRSFVEIVVVIPAWSVAWLLFSFFVLGGGWI